MTPRSWLLANVLLKFLSLVHNYSEMFGNYFNTFDTAHISKLSIKQQLQVFFCFYVEVLQGASQ